MKFELPVGQEALLAERGRLESLLAASEDWRALLQLRSRQERGEGLNAVNAARLEALLIDALAENPFYGRYTAVCAAVNGSFLATPDRAAPKDAAGARTVDDLTRIRGIDNEMARRLRSLGVWTYSQVAEWTSFDIHRVSSELGIGKLIHSQNWIEQAALLALANPRTGSASQTEAGSMSKTAASPAQQFVQPVMLPKQEPLPVAPVAARAALIEAVTRPSAAPAKSVVDALVPAVVQKAPLPEPAPRAEVPAPKLVETPAAQAAPAPIVVSAPPPTPPSPQRVATVVPMIAPVAVAPLSTPVSPEPTAEPVETTAPAPLRDPPRPFVVTRASLASLPPEPAPPPIAKPPEVESAKPAPVAAPPLPPRPPMVPASATAATVPASNSAVPSMTITEAIAYAAAAARSSQRPATNGASEPVVEPAKPSLPPPIPAAAHAVAPSSAANAAAPPPNVPPPLPADFKPAEIKVEAPALKPRAVKFDTPRALTIDRDREEIGGFNSDVEEASVEIVRKTAPAAPVLPKTALAAAVAAAQAAQPVDAPRNATPIGRFLKALTGS
jgi:predicted flap endonuclease-1-like 5' DNA nuclease